MDASEALDFVINTFKITAEDLAARAEVNPHQLSRFRRGHVDSRVSTVMKLANALEPHHRAVFYGLLQGTLSHK